MPIYSVSFAIRGTVVVDVEADTEEDAIAAAGEAVTSDHIVDWDIDSSTADVQES